MIAQLFAGLMFIPALCRAQTVQAILSQDQAIQIAVGFCQRIGASVEGDARAEFPSDAELHYQARWKIRCNSMEIEVIDSTGVVCWFSDSRPGYRLGIQPEGPAISEGEAIRRATAVLTATGQRAELAFLGATLEQHALPARASSHMWTVSWSRQFMGVPYSGPDGVRVGLNAETGEVDVLAVVFRTPPPNSANVVVTAEAAAEVAIDQLIKANLFGAIPYSLEAEVVRPNLRWLPGENTEPLPVLPRIAWKLRFCTGDTYPVVYVDAETGKVIGGERGVARGRATPMAVGKRLQAAREARVYRRAKNGTWPAKPVGVLSDRSNALVFDVLKKAGEHPAGPPKKFPEYKVMLVADRNEPLALGYEAKSAVIGTGTGWFAAPAEFKHWLRGTERVGAK